MEKVRMVVVNRGTYGLPAMELRYRGRIRTYRGSSLPVPPSMRDDFCRHLRDEFMREVDGMPEETP